MSLINGKDAVAGFKQAAADYHERPGVLTSMALDDASVVLKRYLLSQETEQATIDLMNRLDRAVRESHHEEAKTMIGQVMALLD